MAESCKHDPDMFMALAYYLLKQASGVSGLTRVQGDLHYSLVWLHVCSADCMRIILAVLTRFVRTIAGLPSHDRYAELPSVHYLSFIATSVAL